MTPTKKNEAPNNPEAENSTEERMMPNQQSEDAVSPHAAARGWGEGESHMHIYLYQN